MLSWVGLQCCGYTLCLSGHKCGLRRKWAWDGERCCRMMGWVMNMDVSRQHTAVLLMKLCRELKVEEGKVMERGKSLCMKQRLNTL